MNSEKKGFYFLRNLDKLGRICIPRDLRRALGWEPTTQLVLREADGKLVIEKFHHPK